MSTIFISHSSEDNAWAERIRDWLQGRADKQQPDYRYQSLFLDFDPEQGIPVGRSWRETLYEKLQLCRAVIVICSAAYGQSQWCLAELGVAMASGKLVLPVRIDESPPLRLLNETQRTPLVAIDLDPTGLEGWQRLERGLAALSWQERLDWPPENELDASPFPGLSCFERKHAPVFFGQDQTLRQAQAKVEALTASASRLLLILGASGCGKSSLLRAGLVPWLAGAEPGRWIVLDPFRPGRKPFRWLAASLEKAFRAVGQTPPSETARTAVEILEQLEELRAHSGQQDARLVIAIDQFEELLGRSEQREDATSTEADDFLAALAHLLKLKGSRVLILATLRSDFLGSLQLHPSRLESQAGDPILLGPMDVDGFRQVIEGPARRVGLGLETGLSDRLVRDTPSGDALPLLAFTLRELRDGRADGAGITLKQYDDFGGLAGAVQRKADEVLSTSGATAEEIEALERAFIDHLVRLTSDGQAAKQPARLEALPAPSRRLVGLFVEARLLVSGKGSDGDAVEIAHEALLRTWPELVEWIETGRRELKKRRRVSRLLADLALNQTLKTRLASLQSLLALAETNPWVVSHAAFAMEEMLLQSERDSLEWSLAIKVLALVGDEVSVKVLIFFLEQRQLLEPIDPMYATPLLGALCQAAAGLQNIYRRQPPTSEETARWLLLPSATVSDNGRAMRTELVRIRLWATPRLENPGAWFEPLGNGLALTMVRMSPGSFLMGSSADELDRRYNEFPQHMVTLESFLISQTPITQAQWRQVMNTNPSQFKGKQTDRDQRPVERVSWHDAMAFCTELSDRSGRKYNLPSEAQWEFACRAGTTSAFNFGDTITSALANVNANNINLKSSGVLYRSQSSPVGHYPSNRWGLHDMHGNVEEWCLDYWNPRYQEVTVDESSWVAPLMEDSDENEVHRVLRGGSWLNLFPCDCRSASRNHNHPDYAEFHVGFRVVCLC